MKTEGDTKSSVRFPLVPKVIAFVGFFIFFFPGPVLIFLHSFSARIPDGSSSSTQLLFSAAGFALAVLGGIIPATVMHYMSSD
jgi:hypothetical protein